MILFAGFAYLRYDSSGSFPDAFRSTEALY
jgi:hypothetical protein